LPGITRFHAAAEDPHPFEMALDDGRPLARSDSLAEGALPTVAEGAAPLLLPDGRPGRLLRRTLAPRVPEDGAPTQRKVVVRVARSVEALEATRWLLCQVLLGAGALALALSVGAVWLTVRRSLRPLQVLARQIDAIDAARLSSRLPASDQPLELRPAVDQVNDLLARLEAAFDRAREFNADVSHELRTPIAGLKMILEVASSREREPEAYRKALADALQVVAQLEALVENLLLLSRADAGLLEARREPVRLFELTERCLAPLEAQVRARGLRVTNALPADGVLESDGARLRMVVANLVGNAVAYTVAGGAIEVDAPPGVLLRVRDSGPTLAEADLERIFLPFTRLDTSRTGSDVHCGIGLALSRALCTSLELELRAQNRDGWLEFLVTRAS
jgi:signal transduction histidine kinase